jgi:hypothetical protein
MAIESLLLVPCDEKALQALLADEIQANYEYYKTRCYFLKIEKIDSKASQFLWAKEFSNEREMDYFYFDTVYERACAMFKFTKNQYQVLCQGFQWSNWFQVFENTVTPGRQVPLNYNPEKIKMIPKELLQGFGDLVLNLASCVNPKSE